MAYENLKKTNRPKKAVDALKEVTNLGSEESDESSQKNNKKDKGYSDLIKKIAQRKVQKEGGKEEK